MENSQTAITRPAGAPRRRLTDPRRRGTAMALVILIAVVLTGLVMAVAFGASLQAESATTSVQQDRAFFAAESILQQAVWQFKHDNTWRPTATTTPGTSGTQSVGGVSYAYTLSATPATGSSATFTATASTATSSGTVTNAASLTCTAATAVPAAVAVGGGPTSVLDIKHMVITGDVICSGSIVKSAGGSGGISGAADVGIACTLGIAGSINLGTYAPPVINFANLQANAGYTYNSDPGTVFDFDAIPAGPSGQKIIWVKGNVDSPTFKGSGTLIVDGSISNFTSSPSGTVNLVSDNADIAVKGATLTGGLYAVTGVSFQTKCVINGPVVVTNGTITKNGAETDVNMPASYPWFDSRSMTTSNFAGPTP